MLLITGCTGFVGSALVHRLSREGVEIRGLSRNPQHPKDPNLPAIHLFSGNILDTNALSRAMEGVDQVIHLVGILFEQPGQTFEKVHRQGTKNVVDAAKKAGVSRFLHMSSLGTRPDGRSRYHRSKWQAEEVVRKSGLNYTIYRPSVIFGPFDAFTNVFSKMVRYSPLAPLLGDGSMRMQPVWIEDLVAFLWHSLDDETAAGQVFELGGPEQLTFREIMGTIITVMGKRRILVPIPFSLLKMEATILERILSRPPVTTDQLIMARENNICTAPSPWPRYGLSPCAFKEGIHRFLSPHHPH